MEIIKDKKYQVANKTLFNLLQFQVLMRSKEYEMRKVKRMVQTALYGKDGKEGKKSLNIKKKSALKKGESEERKDINLGGIIGSPGYGSHDEQTAENASPQGDGKKSKKKKTIKIKRIISEGASAEEEKREYVDELEFIIAKLQKSGLIAPSPEFIPSFKEMVKLMQLAL